MSTEDIWCPQIARDLTAAGYLFLFVGACSLCIYVTMVLFVRKVMTWVNLLWCYVGVQTVMLMAVVAHMYASPMAPLPSAAALLLTLITMLKAHSYTMTNYAMHVEHEKKYGHIGSVDGSSGTAWVMAAAAGGGSGGNAGVDDGAPGQANSALDRSDDTSVGPAAAASTQQWQQQHSSPPSSVHRAPSFRVQQQQFQAGTNDRARSFRHNGGSASASAASRSGQQQAGGDGPVHRAPAHLSLNSHMRSASANAAIPRTDSNTSIATDAPDTPVSGITPAPSEHNSPARPHHHSADSSQSSSQMRRGRTASRGGSGNIGSSSGGGSGGGWMARLLPFANANANATGTARRQHDGERAGPNTVAQDQPSSSLSSASSPPSGSDRQSTQQSTDRTRDRGAGTNDRSDDHDLDTDHDHSDTDTSGANVGLMLDHDEAGGGTAGNAESTTGASTTGDDGLRRRHIGDGKGSTPSGDVVTIGDGNTGSRHRQQQRQHEAAGVSSSLHERRSNTHDGIPQSSAATSAERAINTGRDAFAADNSRGDDGGGSNDNDNDEGGYGYFSGPGRHQVHAATARAGASGAHDERHISNQQPLYRQQQMQQEDSYSYFSRGSSIGSSSRDHGGHASNNSRTGSIGAASAETAPPWVNTTAGGTGTGGGTGAGGGGGQPGMVMGASPKARAIAAAGEKR